MKKIFCDINIFLDITIRDSEDYGSSARVFSMVENKQLQGFICAVSFPVLFYIMSKELKRQEVLQTLEKIKLLFKITPVNEHVIGMALVSECNDFEDAVQYHSALHGKVDYFVTRNKKDFPADTIPILTPEEFLSLEEQSLK